MGLFKKKVEPKKEKGVWEALDELKLRHMMETGDLVRRYQEKNAFEKVLGTSIAIPTPPLAYKDPRSMTTEELAVYLQNGGKL